MPGNEEDPTVEICRVENPTLREIRFTSVCNLCHAYIIQKLGAPFSYKYKPHSNNGFFVAVYLLSPLPNT